MKETLHLISLRTIRYNDRHSIVTAYSLERGRMAFLQPAGAGREASRRRALMMPLGLVEGVADLRPGRDIHTLGQTRSLAPLTSVRANPIKASIAIFIAEVLTAVIRDSQADENLWHFIEQSILTLDTLPGPAVTNFHICFLFRLGRMLGIEPDMTTFAHGRLFDMNEGVFRSDIFSRSDYLDARESNALAMLARMTYFNMHRYRFSRSERNDVVDGIVRYYSAHYTSLQALKSLDVLRSL